MRDSEDRAERELKPAAEEEPSRLIQVGLNPELSPWQRREMYQLLIELPSQTTALQDSLRRAMEGVCDAMGWTAAFARWDNGSESGSAWHSVEHSSPDLESLKAALERGPVTGWSDEGEDPKIRLEPLIALSETRAREAARNAGFAGYALLPILAAGKPVAMLELFATTAPPRMGGLTRPTEVRDGLEVLATTLSLMATKERMQGAVRNAAAHTRRQMAMLAAAGRTAAGRSVSRTVRRTYRSPHPSDPVRQDPAGHPAASALAARSVRGARGGRGRSRAGGQSGRRPGDRGRIGCGGAKARPPDSARPQRRRPTVRPGSWS